jgi:hypothetical protein
MKHPNKSSFDPSPFELNLGAINGVLFGIGALMLLPSIVLSHWPDAGKGILPCVIWELFCVIIWALFCVVVLMDTI